MDCCNPTYSRKFDDAIARGELEDYRAGRIKKNSRPLLSYLEKLPLKGASLLDIGGGVGVMSFELFRRGLAKCTHVELSKGYADLFESEAGRLGLNAVCLRGDFTQVHRQTESADLVCLDKVICCYPDFRELVQTSCSKALRWYAIVVPRDAWWVRAVVVVSDAWRKLVGDPFRTFVHPEAEVEQIILRNGFTRTVGVNNREWFTALYTRRTE